MTTPERRQQVRDALRLLLALSGDLKGAEWTADEGPRSRLRTVCAVAEGFSTVFRLLILAHLPDADKEAKLGPDLLASVRQGPGARTKAVPALQTILRATSVALGTTSHEGKQEWADLRRLFELRNRITHPKSLADFESADPFLTERVRVWLWNLGSEPAKLLGAMPIF